MRPTTTKEQEIYLFSRQHQINTGQMRNAVGAALEVGGRAKQMTGLDLSVWMTSMSERVGLVSWSVLVESLTDLEAANDKLVADTSYGDLVEQNDAMFVGPLTDILAQVVSGPPETAGDVPTYAMIVSSTAATGQLAAAMAAGVELADAANRTTGHPVTFLSSVTGLYGGVAWILGAPDLAALEDAQNRMNADEEFVAMADRQGTKFAPGGNTTIFRRIS